VQGKVEQAGVGLSSVNAVLKSEIADAAPPSKVEHALNQSEAIEHKVFTIIGEGDIDFSAFFGTLVKNGYSGWLVVEQDVKFGDPTIAPAESVAASLKYLRGVVGGLRNVEATSKP